MSIRDEQGRFTSLARERERKAERDRRRALECERRDLERKALSVIREWHLANYGFTFDNYDCDRVKSLPDSELRRIVTGY